MIRHSFLLNIFLFLGFIVLSGTVLNAKTIEQNLKAFDASIDDQFGYSVAISNDFAVIGSSKDSILSGESAYYTESGSAYIYQWNKNKWEYKQKLVPDNLKPHMKFGISVAIENNYIAVGAYEYNNNINGVEIPNSGAVFIFKYNGEEWVQDSMLVADDAVENGDFGFSVSISGNYLIAGCNMKKPFGAAYIFKNNQGVWTQQYMITSGNDGTWIRFGYSVSIDGDYACVGARSDSYTRSDLANPVRSGSAFIFKREDESWVKQKRLIDKTAGTNDLFGSSVSISGNTVLVGAHGNDLFGRSSGLAYYSIRNETGWSDPVRITAGEGHLADFGFGSSVSVSGNILIVGATGASGKEEKSGLVYVYGLIGEKIIKINTLSAKDCLAYDLFGSSVGQHGKHIIVGDKFKDSHGAAYIFTIRKNEDVNNDGIVDLTDAVMLIQNLSR